MILLKLTAISMVIITKLFLLLIFVYFINEVIKELNKKWKEDNKIFNRMRDSLIYLNIILLSFFILISLLILLHKLSIFIL